MEKLRVAKVDSALLQRGQDCRRGTLHLTQHHLIFVYQDGSPSAGQAPPATEEELWLPYSLLWLVTRLPSILPLDSSGTVGRSTAKQKIHPLLIRLRNFESAALGFPSELILTDVFESIKSCVIAPMPDNLYAFFYQPQPPLPLSPQGWSIYDVKAEFLRQGVGTRTKGWRYCDVNAGYGFCSTYPSLLCVPSRIPDSTIRHASKYRSKERIPALTYLHWANLATITRSSQPLVGLNNRSMQDEKLIEAIFTSHLFAGPTSAIAQAAITAGRNNTSSGNAATDRGNVIAIYGATTTNLIIDARPTTNAMANRAKGAGTENMEHYKGCKKVYLGVDNIHVMRDSLQRVTDALRASEAPSTFGMSTVAAEPVGQGGNRKQVSVILEREAAPLDHIALKRSSWLKHLSALLEGTSIIARNIHVNNSHVLIHCSDGWDRTSQLSALAQVCLDPYYRTIKGFAVLVEKDWCSFGHRFWDRCGHASSEKYFQTAQGYGDEGSEEESGEEGGSGGGGGGFEPQAAANAFWGFTKQLTANFQSSSDGHSSHGRSGAHLKETSPVFHQFLDCVWQIMRQFPNRFEYNETWLLDLFDGLYECKYGTFLYNCESERNGLSEVGMKAPASSRTFSIWDHMLDEKHKSRYSNSAYKPVLDTDSKRTGADLGVLLPNSKDVGFWGSLFRKDGEVMNELVQAEAEERKRQLEALENQRQEESSARQLGAEGPSEVQGVTVGPVVSSVQDDPVLRNGVVDLGKPLGYQPYQSRQRSGQASTIGKAESRKDLPLPNPSTTSRATSPLVPSTASQSQQPFGQGDEGGEAAAAKMKNLFLGWGAKFQDAYTSAMAGTEEQQLDYKHPPPPSPSRRNVVQKEPRRSVEDADPLRHAAAPTTRESESNPWATTSASKGVNLAGLAIELDPTAPLPISTETEKPQRLAEEQGAGARVDEEKTKTAANYDPLGVGGL